MYRKYLAIIPPLIWGTTYVTVNGAFSGWSPFALAAWRALPAGLFLLLLKPSLPNRRELVAVMILGFINITLFFGLLFEASLKMPSSMVGIGMIGLPIIGLIISFFAYGKRAHPWQLFCAALVVACISYLFISSAAVSISAAIYLSLSMFTLIFGSVVAKRFIADIHWWTLTTWKLIFGGLFLLPLAYFDINQSGHQYLSPFIFSHFQLWALIWLVVGVTAVSYAVYIFTIPHISTNELSLVAIINPLLAVILGVILMNNHFSTIQYVIISIMVIANMSSQWIERKFVTA